MTIIDSNYREAFLAGTITALLWSSLTDDDGEFVDDGVGREDDVLPECVENLRAECNDFIDANTADLIAHGDLYVNYPYTPGELAGHDFALTRNRHGAGFWDRGTGEAGDRLTDAAHVYGEVNAFLLANGSIVIE